MRQITQKEYESLTEYQLDELDQIWARDFDDTEDLDQDSLDDLIQIGPYIYSQLEIKNWTSIKLD